MSLPPVQAKERQRPASPASGCPETAAALPKAFSLLLITGQGSVEEAKLRKKLFSDDGSCCSPAGLPLFYQNYQRHHRVSSTIVKNIEQSYDFCNAVGSQASDEDLSDISAFSILDEQAPIKPKMNFAFEGFYTKGGSIFASTAEARTSRENSGYESHFTSVAETVKEERSSKASSKGRRHKLTSQKTLETDLDIQPRTSDQLHVGNTSTLGVSLHSQEEIFEVELFKQQVPFNYEQKVRRSSLGLLPTKTHCFKCNAEVVTDVKLKLPKVSFWKTMCCLGDLMGECSDTSGMTNFQEFQHYCAYCRTFLGAVNPANFR
jgi:hypothetical protein